MLHRFPLCREHQANLQVYVSLYNQKLVMFPYSIIAGIHGMSKADFYQVDENKKEYKVNFD